MEQYFSGNGIQVVQQVNELRIDFDSGRYKVKKRGLAAIVRSLIKEGYVTDWDLGALQDGHINSYFDTSAIGPIRANNGAMKNVDYIQHCATAGP